MPTELKYTAKFRKAAYAINEKPRKTRYVVLHGGRGSGKSHFFAEQLVLRCLQEQTRVACIREVQSSIAESVKKLLEIKILNSPDDPDNPGLGVGAYFQILDTEIRCLSTGSVIIFKGLQSYNAANIKSLEGVDICWIEEGQTISHHSLKQLTPTIRKPGSQIWISYNPRHDTDAVDQMFRGKNVPTNAVVLQVNYPDNAHMKPTDPLVEEIRRDYANDIDDYNHVWLGQYERITEGSYLARYINTAQRQKRIGVFPFDVQHKVYTSWDLGVDDYTAIIYWQVIDEFTDPKVNIIDYYECQGLGLQEIISEAIDAKSYRYQRHFFPHDIRVREIGNGAKQRFQTVIECGIAANDIYVCKPKDGDEAVNAVRQLLPICYFNTDNSNVDVLVNHLRKYSRSFNKVLGTWGGPKHDEHSHSFSAFADFALNANLKAKPKPKPTNIPHVKEVNGKKIIGPVGMVRAKDVFNDRRPEPTSDYI